MRIGILVSLIILLVSPLECRAQIGGKKKGDPRVKALLEETDLKYEVDSDGDFKLILSFDDGRSHVVFIRTKTSELGDLEIREVFAYGYISDDVLSGVIAKNLLAENGRVKLGAWELGRSQNREAAIFSAKIAADTDVDTLMTTVRAVAGTADEKEEELLSTDDL